MGSRLNSRGLIIRPRKNVRHNLHIKTMTISRRVFLLAVAILHLGSTDGFSLSMVASGAPRGGFKRNFGPLPSIKPSSGVTSGLISQLAVVALKLRLKDQCGVKCDVSASSSDLLLRGRVGPVTVRGRGWQSQLGLSCRAIEATVDSCELDVGKIISIRKLKLTVPAKGQAMVALNGIDFASFITHPLMKPPGLSNGAEGIKFLKDEVTINARTGTVQFYGSYLGEKWELTLQRGSESERALVTVSPVNQSTDLAEVADQLTESVSNFFNAMVFELDGTFLTFKDMMVTSKGAEPTLMLALHITVRKFPSPGLEF
mmetsp:Transcript_6856/g.11966  ORF Transcript_6856/g.11966 Transcript_6856/m.11966 type:complete len:315 (-) Transcript_6856:85-1029(-)